MADRYERVRYEAATVALREEAKGVREEGAQNRGPEIDRYLERSHAPKSAGYNWCGFFVYYCYSEAAQAFSAPLPFKAGEVWSGTKLKKWAANNPVHVIGSGPYMPGDIYVMNWGHIGMIISHNGGNIVNTVDGNQSQMDKGKSLKQRTRDINDMAVIIRIVDTGEPGYGWIG
ncbi:MAG: CHAP domain-containing protein [Aridibacter famidurans]|nr:CHAP domain-containing protein [Aridibacter famidurans]